MGRHGARAFLEDAIVALNQTLAVGMEYNLSVQHKTRTSSTMSAQRGERSFVARSKANGREFLSRPISARAT